MRKIALLGSAMASVDKMVGKKYFVHYSVNIDTELYTPN